MLLSTNPTSKFCFFGAPMTAWIMFLLLMLCHPKNTAHRKTHPPHPPPPTNTHSYIDSTVIGRKFYFSPQLLPAGIWKQKSNFSHLKPPAPHLDRTSQSPKPFRRSITAQSSTKLRVENRIRRVRKCLSRKIPG